jgi:hypothetical protein
MERYVILNIILQQRVEKSKKKDVKENGTGHPEIPAIERGRQVVTINARFYND